MEIAAYAGLRGASPLQSLVRLGRKSASWLGNLIPVVNLGVRLWVANVFFAAGLTKIANWNSTLSLFQSEYNVPLLPPELAAYLGTAAELGLPVFLVLGLGTRFAAVALFFFNIVAALSYPDISPLGLKDHQVWGLLLLVIIAHGSGRLSVDHSLGKFIDRGAR